MVYDEYKFVSKNEVHELGCSNLIGTKMLKEYMHGYLMHLKLYNRLKDKIELLNYKKNRDNVIEKRIQEEVPVAI